MNLKPIIARLISIIPINKVRVLAYRTILKYEIDNSKIGFGTLISVDHVKISNCKIGNFNSFSGPISILIKSNTHIGGFNNFECGNWVTEEKLKDNNFKRRLEINENVFITSHHYFDLAGSINIGENSWIAGRGSEFWTHGPSNKDRNIKIGKDCYLSSSTKFTPGTVIGNNIIVGLGSIVTKKFDINNAMIAGVPATLKKQNYDWRSLRFIN